MHCFLMFRNTESLPFFQIFNKLLRQMVFVCLQFLSHSRIFHSFGDVTIAGEGLQIFTFAGDLWPLSIGGSLACHTYYDTRHPFIVVISKDP